MVKKYKEQQKKKIFPTGTLDIIDNYIDDREKDVETGRMSRSDFINEAVNRYLVELGLVEPESNTEVTPR